MTEEKEDSDRQAVDEGYGTRLMVPVPTEMRIRLKRRCNELGIALRSFLRNAAEALLEEDDRVDFIVERSEETDLWKTWSKYLRDQQEKDEETYEKFTRADIEDIFDQLEKEKEQ